MIIKKVTSPAGEEIEILPDSEWVKRVGANSSKGLRQWWGIKPAIIAQLWLQGAVHSKTGNATAELYERIVTAYPHVKFGAQNSLSTLMGDTNNVPAFYRNVNGKRCYEIRLRSMPEVWYRKLIGSDYVSRNGNGTVVVEAKATNGNANGVKLEPLGERKVTIKPWPTRTFSEMMTEAVAELSHSEATPEPLPEKDSEPAIDVEISRSVAMSLLTTVVEIISAGKPDESNASVQRLQSELETVSSRLAQRLEENDRLRRQVREAGNEIQAIRYERDGLRQRLRNTEANLTAALKGDQQRLINNEVQKRIDQFMRAAPTGANAHTESDDSN